MFTRHKFAVQNAHINVLTNFYGKSDVPLQWLASTASIHPSVSFECTDAIDTSALLILAKQLEHARRPHAVESEHILILNIWRGGSREHTVRARDRRRQQIGEQSRPETQRSTLAGRPARAPAPRRRELGAAAVGAPRERGGPHAHCSIGRRLLLDEILVGEGEGGFD